MFEVDHIVVGAAALDDGCAWVADQLGVMPAGGGRHARMGTHNRVLGLGPGVYLEVIAVDPGGDTPFMPRWFGLDDARVQAALRQGPRLLAWVARGRDLAPAAAQLPARTEAHAMERGDFRWTFLFTADGGLIADGVLPHAICWAPGTPHPADQLPDSGCALAGLRGFHPEAPALNTTLRALGLERSMVVRKPAPLEGARLQAMIRTPARGVVILGA